MENRNSSNNIDENRSWSYYLCVNIGKYASNKTTKNTFPKNEKFCLRKKRFLQKWNAFFTVLFYEYF